MLFRSGLFDAAGAHGYLVMSLIAAAGLAGALCLSPMQRARKAKLARG